MSHKFSITRKYGKISSELHTLNYIHNNLLSIYNATIIGMQNLSSFIETFFHLFSVIGWKPLLVRGSAIYFFSDRQNKGGERKTPAEAGVQEDMMKRDQNR